MEDFKLKFILSFLSGIVFSLMFILLAFALPINNKNKNIKTPKNKLEQVSQAISR